LSFDRQPSAIRLVDGSRVETPTNANNANWTTMMHNGGCFCGEISYEFDGHGIRTANCHCTMCRRTSGAPFVTWLIVPAAQFRYLKGTPKTLKSSSDGTRYFCGSCGTPVVCVNASHPEIVDVTLGSLDRPDQFSPSFEVYKDTRLPFVEPIKKD
jgi:hypothetical protein